MTDETNRLAHPAPEQVAEAQDAAVGGLLERLESTFPNGGDGEFADLEHYNPDGPEAASVIRRLEAERDALTQDAERFRALMRCGRISMQGSSGVDPHTLGRNGNNVHFGAEFWPEPIPAGFEDTYEAQTRWGRACLMHLADAILEEEARAALAMQGEGS